MGFNINVRSGTVFDQNGNRSAVDIPQAQPILPVLPGDRQALINKYVSSGYTPTDASRRVDELFANRPVTQGAPPPSMTFAPTGQSISTSPNRVLGMSESAPPAAPINPNGTSFNDAIMQLLLKAQGGDTSMLGDKLSLIDQRFNAVSDSPDAELMQLPPSVRQGLRANNVSGINAQMSKIEAIESARNTSFANLVDTIKLIDDLFPETKKEVPVTREINGVTKQWNPATNIWDALSGTTSTIEPPETRNINGVDQEWNPETGAWETPSGLDVYVDPKAKEEAKIKSGITKSSQENLALIDKIEKNKIGLANGVGTYAFTRWLNDSFVDKAQEDAFLGDINQLINLGGLSKLIEIKAAGGTFGALSDRELDILKDASTKLNFYAIRKGGKADGKLLGFSTSQKNIYEELQRMKVAAWNLAAENYNAGSPSNEAGVQDGIITDPDAFLDSFSGGGSVPDNAQVSQLLTSIPTSVKWGEGVRKTNVGQCGALVNDITGLGVGDSPRSKVAVGDVFVQSTGSPYGHTGIINSIGTDSKGRYAVVTEANYRLNGRTSHTRKLYLNDPKIRGFARPKQLNLTA